MPNAHCPIPRCQIQWRKQKSKQPLIDAISSRLRKIRGDHAAGAHAAVVDIPKFYSHRTFGWQGK